jgi:hypothetical protein
MDLVRPMTPRRIMNVVNRQTLPFAGVSHEFVGKSHGVVNSILLGRPSMSNVSAGDVYLDGPIIDE